MPSATNSVPPPPTTTTSMLSAIHNIPRRMRSGTFGARANPRAPGKENTPPGEDKQSSSRPRRRPAPLLPKSSTNHSASGLGSPSPREIGFPFMPFSSPTAAASDVHDADPGRWAPKDGKIIIKVWAPSTGDIWKLRVPEDVSLDSFRIRVAAKLAFDVSFSAITSGRLTTIGDEATFKAWVAGRVKNGRNTLLTAHRLSLQ